MWAGIRVARWEARPSSGYFFRFAKMNFARRTVAIDTAKNTSLHGCGIKCHIATKTTKQLKMAMNQRKRDFISNTDQKISIADDLGLYPKALREL